MQDDRAKAFLQMIRKAERGRLKIYLGYGPGVGKTYQMLQEAHRLQRDKVDVVVAVVETHQREETEKLVEGLEVVPRRKVEYRGIVLDEMDLSAVLARKPNVAIVDELAHTNVPGSRNGKRYEDVRELINAGIHVIATLNVQHLESLYNTVENLIGVKVRERIPDSVIAEADQIVNVDLSPEDLQARLREGKIYPKERIDPALNNFFVQGNLEHLRELTMREMASQIDFKRREVLDEGDKIAPDQIMVCLASKGPNSARLLRFASRLAGRLNRNWYAVYVQTPKEEPTVIDATTQRLLADTLTLANQLGATVFTFKGENVVDAILKFATEYRVGHIVIGRPRKVSKWRRLLKGHSVAEDLVSRAEGFTVVVVDSEAQREGSATTDFTADEERDKPRLVEAEQENIANVLSPERILMLDEPISKADVIERLVALLEADSHSKLPFDRLEVMAALKQREEQGSTFLNEVVAIPHAKLQSLKKPMAALAVARVGLTDLHSGQPLEFVFLLLIPATGPQSNLRLLTKAIHAFQDLNLQRKILASEDTSQVYNVLQEHGR